MVKSKLNLSIPICTPISSTGFLKFIAGKKREGLISTIIPPGRIMACRRILNHWSLLSEWCWKFQIANHRSLSIAGKIYNIPLSYEFDFDVIYSAGVGRTGTIILSHICMKMAAKENKVDCLRYLHEIRDHRPCMVDNSVSKKWFIPKQE